MNTPSRPSAPSARSARVEPGDPRGPAAARLRADRAGARSRSGGGRLHALIVTLCAWLICQSYGFAAVLHATQYPVTAVVSAGGHPAVGVMRAATPARGTGLIDMRRRYRKPTHRFRIPPPTACPDPVRRRGRGSCRRRSGAGRPDRELARAGRGHDHRRPRRDGAGAAAGGRGRLSRAAAADAVDVHARVLAARARRADPLAGAPAAVALGLAPAGTTHRRARTRRDRVHLSGGDGRAGAAAAHESGRLSDGGDDHRPDGPVLLGAARDRHAPGDVRRVDVIGRADRRARAACAWCAR